MDTAKTIAQQLKTTRRSLRMTQDELAVRAGVSRRTIIAMEAGQTDITLTRFLSITQALGLQLQLAPAPSAKRRPTEAELGALFGDDE